MAPRNWDDAWRRYPASVPLPAEGGMASSKQRGPMAATWWSQRFTQVLESYGLGARMQRGRRYARTGQVVSFEVQPGVVAAQVQGSRRTPYLVTVRVPVPSEAQWATVEAAMTAKVGFVAHLLGGEVPGELEDVFARVGVALFPRSWAELRATCSCPDPENPCKHIAAVLYLLADRLDADPWLLLAWRGRGREEILDRLRGGRAAPSREDEVAPWWPFPPGAAASSSVEGEVTVVAVAPERADAVLDGMDVLGVAIAETPVIEMLRQLYRHVVESGPGA